MAMLPTEPVEIEFDNASLGIRGEESEERSALLRETQAFIVLDGQCIARRL
jgi:hypothetical protein